MIEILRISRKSNLAGICSSTPNSKLPDNSHLQRNKAEW